MMGRLAILSLIAAATATNPTHYGNPAEGCMADEEAVRVQGLSGDFCSPPCKDGSCPTDVPSGDTATPTCALQTTTGSKYCALICTPSSEDTQCGTGSCQPIQGLGICTYSATEMELLNMTASVASGADMVV